MTKKEATAQQAEMLVRRILIEGSHQKINKEKVREIAARVSKAVEQPRTEHEERLRQTA